MHCLAPHPPRDARGDLSPQAGRGKRHTFAFSRRDAPEVLQIVLRLEIRGRREDRVRAAPAVSCAIAQTKTHMSIQVKRRASGLPCAMALRLMPRSPRRRILLFVTVISGLTVLENPVGFKNLRRLDISNGCQDHTVLPYASAPFVCVLLIAHRPKARPAITFHARRCRVHRIPSRVRDVRDTPL